jgi:hypothetical protein
MSHSRSRRKEDALSLPNYGILYESDGTAGAVIFLACYLTRLNLILIRRVKWKPSGNNILCGLMVVHRIAAADACRLKIFFASL